MQVPRIASVAAATVALLMAGQADAADMKVFSSTALKSVLEELGPQYEKATLNKLSLTFGPAAVLKPQLEQGVAFDVAILTVPLIDALVASGKVDGASRTTVARSGLGVAMRAGASKADISTIEGFKRVLLNASSIGFTGQGASRAATEALFVSLGIAEDLKSKIRLVQSTASESVRNGEVEVGIGPISEILAYPGVEFVGPLPPEIQWYLILPAGIAAASENRDSAVAFIKFLTSPAALPVLKAKGMEPG